jgi:magnesium chelatase subunit I
MNIVRWRDEFEQNPEQFNSRFAQDDAQVRSRIVQAKSIIHDVQVSDDVLRMISELCIKLGTDGLRGELTLMRACRAYAALSGEFNVDASHIQRVASMALRHRLRRDPLDDSGSNVRVERALDAVGLA